MLTGEKKHSAPGERKKGQHDWNLQGVTCYTLKLQVFPFFFKFLKLRHILQKSNIYIIMWVNEFFDNCKHSCKPPPKSRYNVSFSSGRCLVSLFQSLCPPNLGRPLFWFLLPGFVSFVLGIMQCALVFLHCVSEIHLCCSNSSHLGDGFLLGLQE